jgi:NAD(P)-dependent dehydrogenase (short-subunit alcohol dehydrogenase family)
VIALVTGASRGVGKGVALALGDAGATVYVTARTASTLEQTAAEVTARGGSGIAVRCDHRDDEAVRRVFSRVPRLDVLVNNVWGGYELLHQGDYERFTAPFWESPLELWDAMFAAGARAHYVASRLAVHSMTDGGLIVNVSSFAARNPREVVPLGVAKAATDRLTALTAEQLRERGIAVVSLYPGLVRTEGILKWKDYLDLSNSESPWFVGRAVAALAADPNVLDKTGETLVVAELAMEYGFTDEDGAQPRSLRPEFEAVS